MARGARTDNPLFGPRIKNAKFDSAKHQRNKKLELDLWVEKHAIELGIDIDAYASGIITVLLSDHIVIKNLQAKTERWFDLDLNLHREDGPAVTTPTIKIWYKHGLNHRADGPSIVGEDSEEWFFENQRHRTDGPAIDKHNQQEWFERGQRHREDGPAIIRGSTKMWYQNDKLHRDDGPAVIKPGQEMWFRNGKLFN